jgi:hypothetical protein
MFSTSGDTIAPRRFLFSVSPAYTTPWVVAALLLLFSTVATSGNVGMCGCEHRYDILMKFFDATNGNSWLDHSGWGLGHSLTGSRSCTIEWLGDHPAAQIGMV